MLIGGDGTRFSMFVYIRADWRKSNSSIDREPQGNWRWNSNSKDEIASSPFFFRPAARHPGELARRLVVE